MDSTLKVIEFVTPKNKYTIFYYKIPVSFGSPHVCKEIVTSIAPEDGRVSPKHVELKVHNKYSIALSW